MSKRQLIIIFAALIVIVTFFGGFPSPWNSVINIVLGLLIIIVAYMTTSIPSETKKHTSVPYVDTHVAPPANRPTPVEKEKGSVTDEKLSAPPTENL